MKSTHVYEFNTVYTRHMHMIPCDFMCKTNYTVQLVLLSKSHVLSDHMQQVEAGYKNVITIKLQKVKYLCEKFKLTCPAKLFSSLMSQTSTLSGNYHNISKSTSIKRQPHFLAQISQQFVSSQLQFQQMKINRNHFFYRWQQAIIISILFFYYHSTSYIASYTYQNAYFYYFYYFMC